MADLVRLEHCVVEPRNIFGMVPGIETVKTSALREIKSSWVVARPR